MRLSAAIAAAAVLLLAAPAAAQPDASRILMGALEQAHQNIPAEVQDFVVIIASGSVRVRLYVHRGDDGWTIAEEEDAPLADAFQGMLIGPGLAEQFRPAETTLPLGMRETRYVGADSVEGRAAHVLMSRVPGLTVETMPIRDLARVTVDAETRQVLRIASSTDHEPSPGGAMANGGHLDMEMTYGGYESINGITLPRRMRMVLRMQVNLGDEQRAAIRDEMRTILQGMAADTSQDAAQTRMLIGMFLRMLDGEAMEIPGTIEDVQVNTGRPEWAGEDG
ncbi:MAG TPA: hypothetical protein VE871_08850 [Longimicrobium sp.]|nr:hypothetical protein [Longimicrobium sp.]